MAERDVEVVKPALDRGGINFEEAKEEVAENTASYKVMPDSRLPVSKHSGKLWKSRRDQAFTKRKRSKIEDAWTEAIDYFFNDQLENRDIGTEGLTSRSRRFASKHTRQFLETENVVFSNTKALVPLIYSKNPSVEITPSNTNDQELVALATIVERATNKLLSMKAAPGLDMKRKAKRAVVLALLTNCAYAVIDFVHKEQASEQAVADMQRIGEELETAKTIEEIREYEGQLQALETRVDMASPSGPTLQIKTAFEVLFDDNDDNPKWMMYSENVPTDYLLAVYSQEDEKGDYKSIFQPTHVLRASVGNDPTEETITNFSLFNNNKVDYKRYGYDDEETFKKACMTKVWYVWDRTTRRVYMFNDKDWSWPIWVWDDPLHLDTFFNAFKLEFYANPLGGDAKGEVTYYLDQQDAVNEINSQVRFARNQAINNILYDDRIPRGTIENILKGDEQGAVGIKLPEGMKLADLVQSYVPPAIQHPELFNKDSQLEAIDRISSVKAALSGQEYKTNTTNKAIENYQATAATVLDEKVDSLEDFIGDIGWAIAQLILQYMSADQISALVGQDVSQTWRNMDAKEIQRLFICSIVGGSSTKPTSKAKKQEAIEVGQVLGQFVQTSPYALLIALKLFEQSFDEIVIKSEDWQLINQSLMQKMQNESAQSQGQVGGPPGAQGEQPTNAEGPDAMIEQLSQLIDSLPPPAKKALGDALAQGVPVKEAIPRIIEMLQQTQGA